MPLRQDDRPFHILLLGDFSGRANRGLCEAGAELASRRPFQLDRDRLDACIDGLGVELTRSVVLSDREPISVRFHALDDFEPDRLFENVELFSSLRSLRERLLSEATFSAAAEEILNWGELSDSSQPSQPTTDFSRAGQTGQTTTQPAGAEVSSAEVNVAQLLDQMLEQAQSDESSSTQIDWKRLIQEIVAPVMPRRIDPRQDELVSCVDTATQTLMAALLHHPQFQQLEAAWRSLDLLVRRVETDVDLKIFIVDVSKAELAADLLNGQQLAESGTYQLIVEKTLKTPGAAPWSLLGGLYRFGESIQDIQLLAQLAKIADAAQVPFLSAADDSLASGGSASTPDQLEPLQADVRGQWDRLRGSAEAERLALLWPRFLLRVPYGPATRPIDAFSFTEMPSGIRHEYLLWGNPAVLAVCAIGQSFAEFGWDLRLAQGRELRDMPVFVDRINGEKFLQHSGESLLTERLADQLRRIGITPVLSVQGRDVIRIPTLLSIGGTLLGENQG